MNNCQLIESQRVRVVDKRLKEVWRGREMVQRRFELLKIDSVTRGEFKETQINKSPGNVSKTEICFLQLNNEQLSL